VRGSSREVFFGVYYALGSGRSLEVLRRRALALGMKPPALSTLKRWSIIDRWQERVAALDAEVRRAGQEDRVLEVQRLNEDQAAIGGMGVQLVAFGLERLMRQVRQAEACPRCGIAPLDLDVDEVCRLMDVFAKWQRLALGEVTDRSEIAISIWNIIIMEITQLFLAVNVYEDADQRKREMVLGIDDVVGRHLQALAGK